MAAKQLHIVRRPELSDKDIDHEISNAYTEYFRNLVRFAQSMLNRSHNPMQAEDVVQEAFTAAFQNWRSFDNRSAIAWLTTIVRNRCRDILRSEKRKPFKILYDDALDTQDALGKLGWSNPTSRYLQSLDWSTRIGQISEWLGLLPVSQRQPILLVIRGYSYSEITDILGLSLDATRMRCNRAEQELHKILAKPISISIRKRRIPMATPVQTDPALDPKAVPQVRMAHAYRSPKWVCSEHAKVIFLGFPDADTSLPQFARRTHSWEPSAINRPEDIPANVCAIFYNDWILRKEEAQLKIVKDCASRKTPQVPVFSCDRRSLGDQLDEILRGVDLDIDPDRDPVIVDPHTNDDLGETGVRNPNFKPPEQNGEFQVSQFFRDNFNPDASDKVQEAERLRQLIFTKHKYTMNLSAAKQQCYLASKWLEANARQAPSPPTPPPGLESDPTPPPQDTGQLPDVLSEELGSTTDQIITDFDMMKTRLTEIIHMSRRLAIRKEALTAELAAAQARTAEAMKQLESLRQENAQLQKQVDAYNVKQYQEFRPAEFLAFL
jgi:RNA polymerase sigma-70 factor (ECF subfamily)